MLLHVTPPFYLLLASAFEPLVVPTCFVVAWTLAILISRLSWNVMRDALNQATQMHQIPCSKCRFFTGDYRLKCTVHPKIALTEAAIGCLDYDPTTNPFTATTLQQNRDHKTTKTVIPKTTHRR